MTDQTHNRRPSRPQTHFTLRTPIKKLSPESYARLQTLRKEVTR